MNPSRRGPPAPAPSSPGAIQRLGGNLLGWRLRPFQCYQPLIALAIILIVYLSTTFSKPVSPAGSAAVGPGSEDKGTADGTVASCQLLPAGGPLDAFGLPGMLKAPKPTLTGRGQRQAGNKGQILDHHDARGDIIKVTIADGVTANLMYTRAGSMRSGDVHNCTQYDIILKGRTRLRSKDLRDSSESVTTYDGRYNFIAIPPRVPHIFEFLEDNVMIEWWDCDFEAWFYKPYRDIVNESIKMAGKSSK